MVNLLINSVVAFHILILFIALVGTIVTWFGFFKPRKTLLRAYFLTISLIVVSYLFTGACIITTWERYLRQTYAPETVYSEGFIAHYLNYLGISIADITSFWLMVGIISVGVLGFAWHHTNIRNVFRR